MQAKEGGGVARGLGGDFLGRSPEGARHRAKDVREVGGLVAPRLGLWLEIPRRQVGRIGLEQQPVARDLAYQLEQVLAAALVADPAGDADVETEIEVGLELLALTGEAVGNRVPHSMRFEDLREPRVGVARMEKKRLAELEAQLELRDEPFLLVGMRRIVAVEVQAALADRDHFGMPGELSQGGNGLRAAVARMVRMHACGRKQEIGTC